MLHNFVNLGIYKCKRLSPGAVQQLLLDVQTVKACVLDLPTLAPESFTVSAAFRRFVERDLGRVEAMLKVLMADLPQLAQQFIAMMNEGTVAELMKISELKVCIWWCVRVSPRRSHVISRGRV